MKTNFKRTHMLISKKSTSDMFRALNSGVLCDSRGVEFCTLAEKFWEIVMSRTDAASVTVKEVLDELMIYMLTAQSKGFQIRSC